MNIINGGAHANNGLIALAYDTRNLLHEDLLGINATLQTAANKRIEEEAATCRQLLRTSGQVAWLMEPGWKDGYPYYFECSLCNPGI